MKQVTIPFWERRRLTRSRWVHETYRPRGDIQVKAVERFQNALTSGELVQVEVNCPVCSSTEFQLISNRDRIGLKVDTVLCCCCPTLYSQKRLAGPSLNLFYSSFYRSMYGGVETPGREWFAQQSKIGETILDWLTDLGLLEKSLNGLTVVEVGAGAGGLLEPFNRRGARTIGIDYDTRYLALGSEMGIEMLCGGAEALVGMKNVDVVILKDVLEHLDDLHEVLGHVRNSLSSTGFCFIQVPGLQSLRSLGYENDLLRYLQFAHVVHFTEESLRFLVQLSGFEVSVSTKQTRLVCRLPLSRKAHELPACPSNAAAVDSLRHVFRTRWFWSQVEILRPFVPKQLRNLLRTTLLHVRNK